MRSFEEWWEVQEELAQNPANEAFAKPVWEAAWDQQQRVIDEMHLAFRDRVLVPVEPTETVVEAIMKRTNYYSSKAGVALYKAMIQAAQEEE